MRILFHLTKNIYFSILQYTQFRLTKYKSFKYQRSDKDVFAKINKSTALIIWHKSSHLRSHKIRGELTLFLFSFGTMKLLRSNTFTVKGFNYLHTVKLLTSDQNSRTDPLEAHQHILCVWNALKCYLGRDYINIRG